MDILECNFFCASSNIIKSTQELAILHLRLSKIAEMIQSYSSYIQKCLSPENSDACFDSADQVELTGIRWRLIKNIQKESARQAVFIICMKTEVCIFPYECFLQSLNLAASSRKCRTFETQSVQNVQNFGVRTTGQRFLLLSTVGIIAPSVTALVQMAAEDTSVEAFICRTTASLMIPKDCLSEWLFRFTGFPDSWSIAGWRIWSHREWRNDKIYNEYRKESEVREDVEIGKRGTKFGKNIQQKYEGFVNKRQVRWALFFQVNTIILEAGIIALIKFHSTFNDTEVP